MDDQPMSEDYAYIRSKTRPEAIRDLDDREYDIWQAENDPLSGARAFAFWG